MLIGLACLSAPPGQITELQTRVEQRPDATLRIDVKTSVCEFDGLRIPLSLPASARDALLTGAWDTTGMLLDRYEEVNAASAKLPYVSGF